MEKIIVEIESKEIRLDHLLKYSCLAISGGQAGQFIIDGLVKINDEVVLVKRKKVTIFDKVVFDEKYSIELKAK